MNKEKMKTKERERNLIDKEIREKGENKKWRIDQEKLKKK